MGWLIVLSLALVSLAALVVIGRLPRGTWELMAAVLLLGVAGYAWQGSPGLAGAPHDAQAQASAFDEGMAAQRRSLGSRFGKSAQWLTMSDAFGRQGDTENAANVLISGLHAYPKDADLWVGMGNALVSHSGGVFSPAAEYSYQQALRLQPDSWSAPYFYGLALARNGQFDGARGLWKPLLARAPEGSALRAQLQRDLAQIDMIAGPEPVVPAKDGTAP